MYTTEVILRLSAVDSEGVKHTVDVPISADRSHASIFEAAHRNADGSLPSVDELGLELWDHARRLRAAIDELKVRTQ
jgi:hypothetical protein